MVSSITAVNLACDPAAIMGGLYGDGIIALKGASAGASIHWRST